MASSNTESNGKNAAAVPQPIPTPATSVSRGGSERPQGMTPPPGMGMGGGQFRRNSFTGWSQSIFGIPQAGRAQQQQQQQQSQQAYPSGASLPTGIPYPQERSHSLSGASGEAGGNAAASSQGGTASSLSSAFSGIGILRRLSVSNGAPPSSSQRTTPWSNQYTLAPASEADKSGGEMEPQSLGSIDQETDMGTGGGHQHAGWPDFSKSNSGLHHNNHGHRHLQPKVLDEMRSNDDDPPSRPDSRMRNLMLSGQFII
ncbi:hypothetical protein LPJ72_004154 [Coemansia sp. Benny D160-2]|nr:hypothetical protein LPJ72_004154 [Coemansia sp. Benny D160-2]